MTAYEKYLVAEAHLGHLGHARSMGSGYFHPSPNHPVNKGRPMLEIVAWIAGFVLVTYLGLKLMEKATRDHKD